MNIYGYGLTKIPCVIWETWPALPNEIKRRVRWLKRDPTLKWWMRHPEGKKYAWHEQLAMDVEPKSKARIDKKRGYQT